jgi:predicted ATPase
MSALDRIEVEGFKSIRKMDLELRPLNVLIGANGAGKTNFISLFKLLNQIVERNLQVFVAQSGGADALLYFGQKTTGEIAVSLDFDRNSYKCKLIPSANDSLIFSEESCEGQALHWPKPYLVSLGGGHSESKLEEEARAKRGEIASFVLNGLRSWRVYHFHDTSDTAKIKLTGDIDDNALLKPNASNLAAFLFLLQERYREHYDLVVETVRMVAPFFDNFSLRPSPLNPRKIQLEWREKGSDAYFNAHSLSDGTLRFICLATLLLQPTLPSTILIDEPELGLHPYAITLLANMLQSAATKRQVILSTQSVPLVNQFAPEDIIVVDREDGQSVFKHLDPQAAEAWLEEYGLGDLWEKNIIGGRP